MTSETKYEYIGYKYYCGYCAKELTPEEHWEEYTKWESISCDCEGAKLEKQANELLFKAQKFIKGDRLKKLHYKDELRKLNEKYKEWLS